MKKKRLKKWLVVLLIVLGFALVFSGTPMDRTAEWAALKFAGETVRIEGFDLLPHPSIRELNITTDDGRGEVPIALRGVEIVPYLWPSGGRYIRSLSVSEISLKVNRDADPENSNWDWFEKYLESGDGEVSDAWIPKEVQLSRVSVSLTDLDQSAHFYLGSLTANVPALNNVTIEFSERKDVSNLNQLEYTTGIRSVQIEECIYDGKVTGDAVENEWKFEAVLQASEQLQIELSGSLKNGIASLACREGSIQGVTLERWPFSEFNEIVLCKKVSIQSFDAEVDIEAPESINASFVIQAEDAEIGGVESDVHVDSLEMIGGWDGALQEGNLSLCADEDVSILAKVFRMDDGMVEAIMTTHSVSLASDSWGREQLLPLLPGGSRSAFKSLDIEAVEGEVKVSLIDKNFYIDADIDSFQDGHDVDAIQIHLNLSGATDGHLAIVGEADLNWGDNAIQGQSYVDENGQYHFGTEYTHVDPEIWFSLIGISIPEVISTRIHGTIMGRAESRTAPISMDLNLTLEDLIVNESPVSTVSVTGNSIVEQRNFRTTADSILVKSVDELFSAELKDLEWDGKDENLAGELFATMDLSWISKPLGLVDWVGEVNGSMSFNLADGHLEAPVKVTSNYLGYRDWLVPYEDEFVFNGEINLDTNDSQMELRYASVEVGKGTTARIGEFTYDVTEGSARGVVDVESDMKLAVGLGAVKEIAGIFNSHVMWSFENDDYQAEWESSASVSDVVLLNDGGTVSNAAFVLHGSRVDGAVAGSGQLSVGKITASGAFLNHAEGTIEIADDAMEISDLTGELFKGIVTGTASVDLAKDTFPLWFDGEIKDIDLAQMTEEVKPPKTNLTGIADGTLNVEYSLDGLLGFTLQVDSTDGFSINRSMVEEMMQTQKLLSGLGQKKAEKALDKFLGNEPQRPFDSAELYLYLIGEKIEGLVDLLSAKTKKYNGLNLHINLDIDKSALVTSLKMLEESNIENMEF